MNIASFIILGFLILSLYLAIRAKQGKDMNLEQWAVGGRGFGTILTFILMAGEGYTTFTFLGASGWAYSKGAPAYYVLVYIGLSYLVAYWLLPPLWKYAKENNLISQSDIFVNKYKSPALGILVSLVGIIAMIPYLVLQLKGLGIIVSETSNGAISPTLSVWIGVLALNVYVMISGIHGSAWTGVIKDILIVAVVVFMGIYIPFHYFGGIQPMFEAIDAAKPGFLTFQSQGFSISWYISTVLMTVIGFYMWPFLYVGFFSAKNKKTLRQNTILMPLYTLMLLFVFFVGFAAVLLVPGLKGAESDLSLLRLAVQTFDPWIVGIIGAAGMLTALVPGSVILMSAATTLSKNIYKVFVPTTSEAQIAKISKVFIPILSLISVYFTLDKSNSLVTFFLVGYSLVTQLCPALFFSLFKNNFVTKHGAFVGIISGVVTALYVTVTKTTMANLFPSLPPYIQDINIGFLALSVNITCMIVVSFFTRNVTVNRYVEELK